MEANICDVNHLDADVLLPPRKRLLAGLKKQSSEGPSRLTLPPSNSSELDTRLNNLLSSQLNNPSRTPEEIAESSRSAAIAAAKAARAARAAAEEKASIASKAVAAAKSALELVASVSEETGSNERSSKKNKLKKGKQVPVQLLYRKHQPVKNYRTDEELARNLHRAINSSPRISKNSSSSDLKNHKHKKIKISTTLEKNREFTGGIVLQEDPHSTCSGNAASDKVDSKGSSREEVYTIKIDEKTLKLSKADKLEMDSGEAGPSHSKDKSREALDDTCSTGRRRGRIKLKKLPLSLCTFRDEASPNDSKAKSSTEETRGKSAVGKVPFFSVEPSTDSAMTTVEAASTWKCQDFKAPQCVKQNKIMQS